MAVRVGDKIKALNDAFLPVDASQIETKNGEDLQTYLDNVEIGGGSSASKEELNAIKTDIVSVKDGTGIEEGAITPNKTTFASAIQNIKINDDGSVTIVFDTDTSTT